MARRCRQLERAAIKREGFTIRSRNGVLTIDCYRDVIEIAA